MIELFIEKDPQQLATAISHAQRYLVEETPGGIPVSPQPYKSKNDIRGSIFTWR